METCVRNTLHELNLAGRTQEEAALRRYEATEWLESLVGPLEISSQPSEREFISFLRSGLVLCNAIKKIQPGSVQKNAINLLRQTMSSCLEGQVQNMLAEEWFNPDLVLPPTSSRPDQVERVLKTRYQEVMKLKRELDLLIVILPDNISVSYLVKIFLFFLFLFIKNKTIYLRDGCVITTTTRMNLVGSD